MVFSSSISLDDVAPGVVAVLEDVGDPVTVDRRFFASLTAPVETGLVEVASLLVVLLPNAVVRVLLGVVVDLTDGFVVVELEDTVGLRMAGPVVVPRFSAKLSVLADVPEVGASEVLLALVLVKVFFFSSPEPEIDGVDLCAELDEVAPVALLAVFRTVDVGGRVGGLLNPLVVRLVEEGVAVLLEEADDTNGLFAVTPGRFGATFSFLTPLHSFDTFSFSVSVSVSASEVKIVLSSPDCVSV